MRLGEAARRGRCAASWWAMKTRRASPTGRRSRDARSPPRPEPAAARRYGANVSSIIDLACVIHCHSTYSDGTGTVSEIAAAASRAGVDAVLLTDHDTLEASRRGE